MKYLMIFITTIFLVGCGGGGGGSSSSTNVGQFVDAPVEGLEYSSSTSSEIKTTDANGQFYYQDGEKITFKIGQVILGDVVPSSSGSTVTPLDLVGTNDATNSKVVEILRVLQSIDSDGNPTNGIKISQSKRDSLNNPDKKINLSESHAPLSETELQDIADENNLVSKEEAQNHFQTQIEQNAQETNSNDNSGGNDNSSDSATNDNSDENDNDSGSATGGNSGNGGSTTTPVNNGTYTLLAWNDLGMHCMDGKDFSVFSILPPYNNLDAQLILKDGTNNKHVTSGVTLTYEALDYAGHINTTSVGKTNFFSFKNLLFPGAGSTQDVGLTGNKTPSHTPNPMTYNATNNWFEATGLPILNL